MPPRLSRPARVTRGVKSNDTCSEPPMPKPEPEPEPEPMPPLRPRRCQCQQRERPSHPQPARFRKCLPGKCLGLTTAQRFCGGSASATATAAGAGGKCGRNRDTNSAAPAASHADPVVVAGTARPPARAVRYATERRRRQIDSGHHHRGDAVVNAQSGIDVSAPSTITAASAVGPRGSGGSKTYGLGGRRAERCVFEPMLIPWVKVWPGVPVPVPKLPLLPVPNPCRYRYQTHQSH